MDAVGYKCIFPLFNPASYNGVEDPRNGVTATYKIIEYDPNYKWPVEEKKPPPPPPPPSDDICYMEEASGGLDPERVCFTPLYNEYEKHRNKCMLNSGRTSWESEYVDGNGHIDQCKEGCDQMLFCTSFEFFPIRNKAHEECMEETEGVERRNKCRCMISVSSWGKEKATKAFTGKRYGNVSCYIKLKPEDFDQKLIAFT